MVVVLVTSVALAQPTPPPPPPPEQGPASGSVYREPGAINDRSAHTRPWMLSGLITLPWFFFGGFPLGINGRLYIPLVNDGFIPPINDEFGLEVGADLSFLFANPFGFAVDIPAEAMWKFHITSKFAAYAKLGLFLGIGFGPYAWFYGGTACGFGFGGFGGCGDVGFRIWPIGATGILYELSNKLHLRAEVGNTGLKVGLGFDL